MYPISNYPTVKRTYRHGDKTFYSNFHLGVDLIVPTGTHIYAPFDCDVRFIKGKAGGNMAYCYFDGLVARFLHCSEVLGGRHTEGSLIAKSGNTGLSTGPHIHLDISPAPFSLTPKEKFLDPDKFNWFRPEEDEDMGQIEDLKKQVQEWRDKYNKRVPEVKRERDAARKELKSVKNNLYEADNHIRKLDDEIDVIKGNLNVMTDKVVKTEAQLKVCKKDAVKSMSISDHLRAIWSIVSGSKEE